MASLSMSECVQSVYNRTLPFSIAAAGEAYCGHKVKLKLKQLHGTSYVLYTTVTVMIIHCSRINT